MKNTIVIALMLVLVGCASHQPRHIVDTKGVDQRQYKTDARECRAYAEQVDTGGNVANGAIAGAIFGALLGAAIGGSDGAKYGAKAFAVTGAADGAVSSAQDRKTVYNRCMAGRGYNVLL